MKKFTVIFMALLVAVLFCACSVSQTVTQLDEKGIKGMTPDTAAGVYTLNESSDARLKMDKYAQNTLELTATGEYTLTVKPAGENAVATISSGTYTIADNGVISLVSADGNKTALISLNEKVVCNGKELTATGTLGSAVTMNYTKDTAVDAE